MYWTEYLLSAVIWDFTTYSGRQITDKNAEGSTSVHRNHLAVGVAYSKKKKPKLP